MFSSSVRGLHTQAMPHQDDVLATLEVLAHGSHNQQGCAVDSRTGAESLTHQSQTNRPSSWVEGDRPTCRRVFAQLFESRQLLSWVTPSDATVIMVMVASICLSSGLVQARSDCVGVVDTTVLLGQHCPGIGHVDDSSVGMSSWAAYQVLAFSVVAPAIVLSSATVADKTTTVASLISSRQVGWALILTAAVTASACLFLSGATGVVFRDESAAKGEPAMILC